ncbi:hypothetical protein NpNSSI1_00005549 [Neofusicoccum parvum]|uniref:Uncharacterized protein n=1 Tax=Neofusicoccum parvum TaxID=310453 RepID=A0ACB5SMB7_9PEZI|nr:hypothetical protein NpNSSI1_00005549 [Neofusicoccum parvum]GME48582.1 hypothetical protein NpPPO83_00011436 [Neofusicoccum parvum]
MARNKANLTNALNGTAIHGLNLPGKSDTASIQSVFASTNFLTSCYGVYTNKTTIRHLHGCSTRSLFSFDDSPSALSTTLKHSSNTNITLSDLNPSDMKYDLAG